MIECFPPKTKTRTKVYGESRRIFYVITRTADNADPEMEERRTRELFKN